MEKKYDIAIVGAGPAGSLAAKTAAEKGLKTIFFERGKAPGHKSPSGCCIIARNFRDFPWLLEMDLPSQRWNDLTTWHFYNQDLKEIVNFSYSAPDICGYEAGTKHWGLMAYKSDLDPYVANLAVKAGAELKTSTLVTDVLRNDKGKITGVLTEDGDKYFAEVVIGADGSHSIMAQKAGLRGRWRREQSAYALSIDFGADPDRLDDIVGNNATHWCTAPPWYDGVVFIKKAGFHLLLLFGWVEAYGVSEVASLNSFQFRIDRALNLPFIKRLIKLTNAKPREYQAGMVPMYPVLPPDYKSYTDGFILAGDSAGQANPIDACGIFEAFHAGKLAAEVAAKCIADRDTSAERLKEYQDTCTDPKHPLGTGRIDAPLWLAHWYGLFIKEGAQEKIRFINNALNYCFFPSHDGRAEGLGKFIHYMHTEGAPVLADFYRTFYPMMASAMEAYGMGKFTAHGKARAGQ